MIDIKVMKKRAVKKAFRNFSECLNSGFAEKFLETLLNLMCLIVTFDKNFRRNIENFTGRYNFRSLKGDIKVSVLFNNGKMKVKHHKLLDNPDLTINFRDGKALMKFLISSSDLLSPILHQDVIPDGNLNYLSKFGYMAKHLQLMVPKV